MEKQRKLPADQDPNENDDNVKPARLSELGWHTGKHMRLPTEKSSADIMGNVAERDKSAKAAEQWLAENDPEKRKKPPQQME